MDKRHGASCEPTLSHLPTTHKQPRREGGRRGWTRKRLGSAKRIREKKKNGWSRAAHHRQKLCQTENLLADRAAMTCDNATFCLFDESFLSASLTKDRDIDPNKACTLHRHSANLPAPSAPMSLRQRPRYERDIHCPNMPEHLRQPPFDFCFVY